MADALLSFRNLTIDVIQAGLSKPLIRGVDLNIRPQEIMALVGGSGSGKTTLGLAVLRLLPDAFAITSGDIVFEGQSLLGLAPEGMRRLRGKDIGLIFQEPLSAFNPLFTVGAQIEEVLVYHSPLGAKKRRQKVLDLLSLAGVPDPSRVARSFPHQLSGGLRQRSMIAQALAGSPQLLIADEPTSSIDVTLQVKVMDLFRRLKKEFGLSVVLITHDLGVVRHLADRVYVMNQGRIVEQGLVSAVMDHPQEEYTRRLIAATA